MSYTREQNLFEDRDFLLDRARGVSYENALKKGEWGAVGLCVGKRKIRGGREG